MIKLSSILIGGICPTLDQSTWRIGTFQDWQTCCAAAEQAVTESINGAMGSHLSTVNKQLTQEDISFVSDLVQQAGHLAAQMREGVDIRNKAEEQDKVTAADIALSKLLVTALSERFAPDVIVSEEDDVHALRKSERAWLIDPIDGTDNYIRNDGQYVVMVGVLIDAKPIFGWVFAPATNTLYLGGPQYGAWKQRPGEDAFMFAPLPVISQDPCLRVAMGGRDRVSHPWVKEHPKVEIIKVGSIGLKVAKILEGEADMFVHLSGKLKIWDTAGPSAIALGAGLDVGGMDSDELLFPSMSVRHECSVIVGRPGSLLWSRRNLQSPIGSNGAP